MKKYLFSLLLIIFILGGFVETAGASTSVILNGKILICDVPPGNENGTILVPLRSIFEALAATVSWDDDSQTVTAKKGANIIELKIGSSIAIKNGLPVYLDVPGKIVNGKTMIPVRFVSEAMGCTVKWVEEIQTVFIYGDSNPDSSTMADFEGRIIPIGSMMPTLNINDRVLIDKHIYSVQEPQRGDIILLIPPEDIDSSQMYLKRIVAIPGDTIAIKNGQLYINDKVYIEPYILEPMDYDFGPVKVSADNYIVLGDNRNSSYDSHRWPNNGCLPKSNIIGKAQCIYWPLDHQKNL